MVTKRRALLLASIVGVVGLVEREHATAATLGFKVSAGGRFDTVRMCVATAAGVKGGPAADISAVMELAISDKTALHLNLPVMRPALFAAAFKMLQFEPGAALLFRREVGGGRNLVFGPSLGISLHYGPDYESSSSGDGRGPSFFAMGPMIGAHVGLDLRRAASWTFQLGLSPYVTPLFSISDPRDHHGVVAGGMLEGKFLFH